MGHKLIWPNVTSSIHKSAIIRKHVLNTGRCYIKTINHLGQNKIQYTWAIGTHHTKRCRFLWVASKDMAHYSKICLYSSQWPSYLDHLGWPWHISSKVTWVILSAYITHTLMVNESLQSYNTSSPSWPFVWSSSPCKTPTSFQSERHTFFLWIFRVSSIGQVNFQITYKNLSFNIINETVYFLSFMIIFQYNHKVAPHRTGTLPSYTQKHTFQDHLWQNGDSTGKDNKNIQQKKAVINMNK